MNENPMVHPIRSYVLRQGRMSDAQKRAYDTHGETYLLPYQDTPLDLSATFGRQAPVVLEIGCGMGETTVKIAQDHPDIDYLGIEVHAPGVGALLKLAYENGLTNVRMVRHDAVEVVRHMLPEVSLDGAHIYFPDPWPKKRHHKRRLIQSEFVRLLCTRVKAGGYVHCATDWEDYAQQMLTVLSAESALRNSSPQFAPRPDYRPQTKFERRGIKLGHDVWDLIFLKS